MGSKYRPARTRKTGRTARGRSHSRQFGHEAVYVVLRDVGAALEGQFLIGLAELAQQPVHDGQQSLVAFARLQSWRRNSIQIVRSMRSTTEGSAALTDAVRADLRNMAASPNTEPRPRVQI